MHNEEYQLIAINFLSLKKQDFDINIFVKKADLAGARTKPTGVKVYKLPSVLDEMSGDYVDYHISVNQQPGFIPATIKSNVNRLLTVQTMYLKTIEKCKKAFNENEYIVEDGFRKGVIFKIAHHKEGSEEIWIEPYHLSITNEYGYLIGFHFRLADGQILNKTVLQKSLSLGSDGRENINYYSDHYKKLLHFITHFIPRLFPLNESMDVEITLRKLKASRLNSKKYIFKDQKTDTSQFQGIKRYGPLKTVDSRSLIGFVYKSDEKNTSYELYYALKGKYPTFSGMEDMFSISLDKEHVQGISIPDYSNNSIMAAINQMKAIANGRQILPLLIVPWSRLDLKEEGALDYYRIKHQFLSERMPSQFVSLKRIRARDSLKWSISNIGLAIFSKLGGMPWKLQPTNENCLIIGIGQAHRIKDDGVIDRFYAYSVLTDSSGLYDSIRILSRSKDKNQYLNGLTKRIKQVILSKALEYEKFVIHTSFKLRIDEIDAIKNGLEDVFKDTNKEIVVLKFNDNGKYFGFSQSNNSKVPFESSCLPLGKRQYLIWFEGLQYHNPTLRRRIAKPMHIEFIYSSHDLSHDKEISFLQDAINISGANWRGFNAKSSPISVYYSRIIADYISHFDEYGLPEIDIEDLAPWFL